MTDETKDRRATLVDRLQEWKENYSTSIFPEPSPGAVKAALLHYGISTDSVSAMNYRAAADRIVAIVEEHDREQREEKNVWRDRAIDLGWRGDDN